jgi:hypothetical protein
MIAKFVASIVRFTAVLGFRYRVVASLPFDKLESFELQILLQTVAALMGLLVERY